MFNNYSMSQWLGILEYFCIVFVLFTGAYITSVKLTYMSFKKNKKVKIRVSKKVVKKQVFFDVA